MHTIDFHAHPVPASFRQWLHTLGIDVIADDGFPLPKWSAQEHLKFMDDAGIDYTVLSLPTPHIHQGDDAVRASEITLSAEEVRELEQLADTLGIRAVRMWEKEMK